MFIWFYTKDLMIYLPSFIFSFALSKGTMNEENIYYWKMKEWWRTRYFVGIHQHIAINMWFEFVLNLVRKSNNWIRMLSLKLATATAETLTNDFLMKNIPIKLKCFGLLGRVKTIGKCIWIWVWKWWVCHKTNSSVWIKNLF